MIRTQRRQFLKNTLVMGVTSIVSLIMPRMLLAAWPKSAFEAKELSETIANLYENTAIEESTAIEIKAPDIAENGAVVPITIETSLNEVTRMALIAPGNANPLVGEFVFTPDAVPFISTRIKMAKTGDVVAVVTANGKLYSARCSIKVTIGGCGG